MGLNEVLPQWPVGTVAILVTGGGPPHAITVSAAVRAEQVRQALLELARRPSRRTDAEPP